MRPDSTVCIHVYVSHGEQEAEPGKALTGWSLLLSRDPCPHGNDTYSSAERHLEHIQVPPLTLPCPVEWRQLLFVILDNSKLHLGENSPGDAALGAEFTSVVAAPHWFPRKWQPLQERQQPGKTQERVRRADHSRKDAIFSEKTSKRCQGRSKNQKTFGEQAGPLTSPQEDPENRTEKTSCIGGLACYSRQKT